MSSIDRYIRRMLEAVDAWESTEEDYAAIVATYRERNADQRIADIKASSDPNLKLAAGDGAWHRDRASTYALAAIALMLAEERSTL